MKYAVVAHSGKQYKITEGQVILVDKLPSSGKKEYVFEHVLMVRDGEKVEIGTPYVPVQVTGKILEEEVKGEKIYISKFRAKVHYRRRTGFRPQYTKVQIETIGGRTAKSAELVKEKKTGRSKTKLP